MNKSILKGLMVLTLCMIILSGCTNKELEKMDYNDLYATVVSNGARLEKGMTEEQVVELLGEPTSKVDSRLDKSVFDGKGFIYGDYVELKYDNTSLQFYIIDDTNEFLLAQVWANDDTVTFARDIKVGMTKDEIMSKFYKADETKYTSDDEEPWGEFIYGEYTNSDFDNTEVTSPYKFAYINYNANCLVYEVAKASGDRQNVTSEDENINMIFYYNDDDKIDSIMWSFNPELKY